MGFFQQVKLLLWKNGLNVIRNPVWSLTLIVWPLIIFIIVAVTRQYYPPKLQNSCYVEPRNLPSTGFFPFLQTVLCNTDSKCYNTSRLLNPSKFSKRSTDSQRSTSLSKSLFEKLMEGAEFSTSAFPNDSIDDPSFILEKILGAAHLVKNSNASVIHTKNTTFVNEPGDLHKLMEAMNLMKQPICTITLVAMNTTSPNTISNAVINFCSSNNTVFEVFLQTLNQIVKEELLTEPAELAKAIGAAILVFQEIQNQNSLWENLLDIPELVAEGSFDHILDTAAGLLANMLSIMHIIQKNFTETAEPISDLHPIIVGGINILHYFQNWPGNDVTISLGDIVNLDNDSFSEIVEQVLQTVQIPLPQAMLLTLDRHFLQSYICDSSSNPLWLTTLCYTGTVTVLLDKISPNKVAQQALLAWSKHVAPHDVSFAQELFHSLLEGVSPGGIEGSNAVRNRRDVDTQPQNIEEELFLTVGQVLLELSEIDPEVGMIVQRILSVGFHSMETATLSIDIVLDMMDSILKDSNRLENLFTTLLTNETEASIWIGKILDSTFKVIIKSLTSHVTCEDALGPFQWLLPTETIKFEVWESIICENATTLEDILLADWMPLIEKGEELYMALNEGGENINATLPMILSAWHKLLSKSMEFGDLVYRLSSELEADVWINGSTENSFEHITETLRQSVFVFMVNLGETAEASHLWPEMKNYFHIAYWVLTYRAGVTTQPANCSLDIDTLNIHCDTGLNWHKFVETLIHAVTSPNQDILVNFLKAAVNLLHHVYGDLSRNVAASFLAHEIHGGDALSAYLINLMTQLGDFVSTISMLSDENISDKYVLVPLLSKLFKSTGLSPLLPLLFSSAPVDASSIIDIVVKLGRSNQHIFTFDETDPTMPELEHLIMQFLSSESNLTLSLSYMMGNTLLTYSNYFDQEKVALIKEGLKPFTNQTSSGIVEAILTAMELLNKVVASPNSTNIILSYIQQLQECIVSLYKLRRIQQVLLPTGEMSTAEVTDLHQASTEFLNLLTPEGLSNLTHIGPEAALDLVIEKFLAFLPPQYQHETASFYQDINVLLHQLTLCASEEDCLPGISELFTLLNEIVDLALSADVNVTIHITSKFLMRTEYEYEDVASAFFSLLLSPNEASYVRAFRQTLHFIRLVLAMPDITVFHIQNALRQSNLTLEELNYIAHLAGAANANELLVNIMEIANVPKCFELQHDTTVTAQCVVGLIDKASKFLTNIPALHDHTAIISLVPLIVNKTTTDLVEVDFHSDALMPVIHALNNTLNNIKMNLQMNNLSTPEIMEELKVMEGLLKVAANPEPLKQILDAMSVPYSEEVTIAYLQIMQWYLHRLENVTSTSLASHLLHPFFRLTQLQVTLQLAQTNLTLFINNQIGRFQHPTDGAGVSDIGQATIEILQQILKYITVNLKVQDETAQTLGSMPLFNTALLHEIEEQIQLYLDEIHLWMTQPNVTSVFSSMLHWGNPYINASTPVRDLHLLLQTLAHFLTYEQLEYLHIISNITHSLSKAIMVLEQPGDQQFDQLYATIMEAVQYLIQILTHEIGPLPHSVQQNIQEIVHNSLVLFVETDLSFSTSLNLTLNILTGAESVVQQLVPEEFVVYLLPGFKVVINYLETITVTYGRDNWNFIILNQMKTIRSLLPPDSTAQYYFSVVINIIQVILDSSNVTATTENDIQDTLTWIFNQIWQILMHGPDLGDVTPSFEAFSQLEQVFEQIFTGQADKETWHKLEKMLEAILSTLSQVQPWDSVTAGVPYFEKTIACMVNTKQKENMMLLSLAKPVMDLISEIAQSVNSSHFNLSEIAERMPPAIEQTVLAAQQANGTLDCNEVLKAWDPVRVAAGLSQGVIEMWCTVSLQPILEAYAALPYMCPHLNMSHMALEPITVADTAARIVNATESLYQVNKNQFHVMEQIIMNISNQFFELLSQPLSPSAELNLHMQLQHMQLQNSLSSITMLSDELLNVAPMLRPCIDAMAEALSHILNNYHQIQDTDSSEVVFNEVVAILLSCINTTLDDFISLVEGDLSGISNGSFLELVNNIVKIMINMNLFGDEPMVYNTLEQLLSSNATKELLQKLIEMSAWLASTNESGLDLLTQALPKMSELLRLLLSILTHMGVDMPEIMDLVEDLTRNIFEMLRQLLSSDLFTSMDHHPDGSQWELLGGNRALHNRRKREALLIPQIEPLSDFSDLLSINYQAIFGDLSAPTPEEMLETAHMFVSNPNLNIILKGSTNGMPWAINGSREETIDAALGLLSFATLSSGSHLSSLPLLAEAIDMLPDSFPFSALLKNMTTALASESQENLILLHQFILTATHLLHTDLDDPHYKKQFDQLTSQMCMLERTKFGRHLLAAVSLEPGQLCSSVLPGLEILLQLFQANTTDLSDALYHIFIGDPSTYGKDTDWSNVLMQSLNFDISSLKSLNINFKSQEEATVGEMLRNESAFVQDVLKRTHFDPVALQILMRTVLPNNNLQLLSWLLELRHCKSPERLSMIEQDAHLFQAFCSMSSAEYFTFPLVVTRHLNVEKVLVRVLFSDEIWDLMGFMLQIANHLVKIMDEILPAIDHLQSFMLSIEELNHMAQHDFYLATRRMRSRLSTRPSFVTISQAMCSHGIIPFFGISKFPTIFEPRKFPVNSPEREEVIERFKIPRDASPYCMNMYLDMVSTTGGAISWAFLKPMLMGKILYTPDTPITRAIMEKANTTLQEFSNLRRHSNEWMKSSNFIMKSANVLDKTVPLLKNSLSNAFVKNFIEMQTNIDVDKMTATLNNFSNMTLMLEKNKHIMDQITVLSSLMVNISSCIKFDRYRGYQSAEQLDADAQELAKDRDLYGSVIFKLPNDHSSSLPPKVSYTIRMHLDNVMRTDRARSPYFVKDTHISAGKTMRYNRAFVYLQENIDRAIIEMQAGKVTDIAVQLQPFPYPCYLRDKYLEAITIVFPLMLMLAWILFVADFVKKLVHERELGLHQYMKMMGVNPFSHFLAWFLECAAYLIATIIIMTLILKHGGILSHSNGFLLFLYLSDYGLTILAFSYMISSFFDKTYIAGLSGSLLYIICFFPYIVVLAVESSLNIFQKSALSLFSPCCFSYASQYISLYESMDEGIQWSNSYSSPLAGDTSSFGWLCWMMLIDSIIYFSIGAYIRMVFPGKYGIPAPWYFPFTASFWADLFDCCRKSQKGGRGLLFTNTMNTNLPGSSDGKGKGESKVFSQTGEDFSHLPVGVALHGLTKIYSDRVGIKNLNLSFHEGHVTSLLGHNGAGKTTTMSLLTGLFPPSSGNIEVYGRNMRTDLADIRKDLGVCMQYDVLFDHMTTKEHLLLYGQIKAPQWSHGELHEQVRTILEETGMYAHRHKRVGTLSGGMKRKLSISIAFIGGSRLVVLDEPTTGVDPCSRRSIWDIIIQNKPRHTIIMSTHHLDEAEMLSDRIAFLERGGLKCCGSPFYLKEKLSQGYKLTLTKKVILVFQNNDAKCFHHTKQTNLLSKPLQVQILESERFDDADLKAFIQDHIPEARLKEAHGGDLIYALPPFTSSNSSSYSSLLTALDANLDDLQLGGYSISDTTLEEVFLQLIEESNESVQKDRPFSVSETISDTHPTESFPADPCDIFATSDKIGLTGSNRAQGMSLAWQQIKAILIKRFHHSRRNYRGLISQILLPVLFVTFAMGLGSIKNDLLHYPELELSPALYNFRPGYSFFSEKNGQSSQMADAMMSFPGMDNSCLDQSGNPMCTSQSKSWNSNGKNTISFSDCKCTIEDQTCHGDQFKPAYRQIPSSQIVYNLSGINVENYLVTTANTFIRNRYGGFEFGMKIPSALQMDLTAKSENDTLSKVWFNPEGYHTMPAYLNSLNNLILRSKLPADKDPKKYAISVSSHPYFGRTDEDDSITMGMLQILVAMCVLTGYSITTASFSLYIVTEHQNGSKRLQHIAGISEPFYWVINFLYDMILYLIPVSLTIGVIAAFQIPSFTEQQNLGAVSLLLVLFGFATFPWMYLLSGVFKDAETAFITYVCINLCISINTIMSTSILYFMGQRITTAVEKENVENIFNILSNVFLIFPQFNFGNGLMKLARMNVEVQVLRGYGIDAYKNPYSIEVLGWMFISSIILSVVFFALRLLLNTSLVRKVRHLILGRKKVSQLVEDEDEDVKAERLRVASGAAGSDILQVNQLTKIYRHLNKKIYAVKRLSVGIPAGECFGLLGVNGAGKTTTFKMLTGEVSPSDGSAQIRAWDGRLVDIMECRHKGINIGYCPQVDALDNLLTGEEHLYFYARIHGISKREIDKVVNYLLKRLELNYYRNITTDGYSCGTRRKLSTAIALIGHPQILLLDEPSSGMDPRTKRHLWKIISEEVKGKTAVVLTSHSMEECEALCSRLAIMVKGQFRCLGSLQHIKNRFGSGFTVKMHLAESASDEAITAFMQKRFPSTYLKDQHSSMAEYRVPIAHGGVAAIFQHLERNKISLKIKHFSVSQTTLDEVFINFALGNIHNKGEEDDLGSIRDITA
ncbi:glucosylceramide transporter ABCA12-like isoform X1 [Corythoichthys intestinalis]|uniref:glucosylceramide transporter ABCA12-like isoform X1 n=1 Tax=Corythoichthys intestinalis TaxID=161448 RepID=UPI0025A50C17|nr:glucosylceramide transporter ABCA12-like isoform X1 [Corythoichthys intestinalis]